MALSDARILARMRRNEGIPRWRLFILIRIWEGKYVGIQSVVQKMASCKL